MAGTLFLYWPATRYEFVAFDDSIYVASNPHVQPGITWSGLKWAFTATDGANWHPLTWISHMVDCQFFGPKAGGHHFTSILLHAVNAGMLFALMFRLTRQMGPSFAIAALFAWHPLHVESVAWVAERKDVLSTCFGLLSLLAYAGYARTKTQISTDKSGLGIRARYVASLLFFAFSLMSKPMLVTLPFVMLLLDFWPLRRSAPKTGDGEIPNATPWKALVLEKLPFLLLAALCCVVTLWAQAHGSAIAALKDIPISLRIANAELSYFRYLSKLLWPHHLAVFYPLIVFKPEPWLWVCAVLLLGISVLLTVLKRFPYLAVGWFWFLGTLIPVIGLVQVGSQAMADRYTYFPSIGIFILAVFGIGNLASKVRNGSSFSSVVAGVVLCALLISTHEQLGHWRESETLFSHAAQVTDANFVACNNLGVALAARGEKEAAIPWYLKALLIKPDYADAHCNLATCYADLKRSQDGIEEFEAAIRYNPRLARAHYLLANQLLRRGDAVAAEAHYKSALETKPDYAEAHYQMAVILLARNETARARDEYRAAVRLKPDWVEALNNLAWLLSTDPDAAIRDANQAFELAQRGTKLTHTNDARLLDTLGAALAELGRFDEAVTTAKTGAILAQSLRDANLETELRQHITYYQKHQPFREAKAPIEHN